MKDAEMTQLVEAQGLPEASQILVDQLKAQNEKLKREKEKLSKNSEERENRCKNVLKNARSKINKVEEEKKELQSALEQLKTASGSTNKFEEDKIWSFKSPSYSGSEKLPSVALPETSDSSSAEELLACPNPISGVLMHISTCQAGNIYQR